MGGCGVGGGGLSASSFDDLLLDRFVAPASPSVSASESESESVRGFCLIEI